MKVTIEDTTGSELLGLISFLRVEKDAPSPTPEHVKLNLRKLSDAFQAANSGQKIQAIKIVREMTGCGLKEAKDVVEGNFY